jgi:hypothetical protein
MHRRLNHFISQFGRVLLKRDFHKWKIFSRQQSRSSGAIAAETTRKNKKISLVLFKDFSEHIGCSSTTYFNTWSSNVNQRLKYV